MNDDAASFFYFIVLIFWIAAFGVAGWVMGEPKGAGQQGATLGALLGPIGLVITAFMQGDRVNCRFCNELIDAQATICHHCMKSQSYDQASATPAPVAIAVQVPRIKGIQPIAPRYFICRAPNGEVLGPYQLGQITSLRAMDIVDAQTLFCREGSDDWHTNPS